jgi:serine/threonine protein kinase
VSCHEDVWAFGVVLWEIFSYGQAPYPGLSNSEVIQEVSKGYRMPPPDNCPGQIVELMNECWHDDPLKRPQWINIFVKLSALEEKYGPFATHRTQWWLTRFSVCVCVLCVCVCVVCVGSWTSGKRRRGGERRTTGKSKRTWPTLRGG